MFERFHLRHHALMAEGAVTAHQRRTLLRGQFLQQGAEPWQTVFGRMGLAVLDLDLQHQANMADPVGVQHLWPGRPGFLGLSLTSAPA